MLDSMESSDQLNRILVQLDGCGYAAYKSVRGSYDFGAFELHIDHVQVDPFAAPSRMRVCVPQHRAAYPAHTYCNRSRAIGLSTYLIDAFADRARTHTRQRESARGGPIQIARAGQQLLERSALRINEDGVEARFTVDLPAAGRRILGYAAAECLCEHIPHIVASSLTYAANDHQAIERYLATSEDADALRAQLSTLELVAFVADGSLLPRRSGIDDRPLETGAVSFSSPPSLRVEVKLPHAGRVAGMGISPGVTLIAGGGFHGKSTLLRALERGVYNHRPDDGRQLVICDSSAVKVRAEDGRSVSNVDISPFIDDLPIGQPTAEFSSENASGSTSQAANLIEAIEAGCRVLLIDEDTAATNFMVRDARMQQLISDDPITPLVDQVRPLYRDYGISTVLVVGGQGDYLDVADRVIAMDGYRPHDITQQAREVVAALPAQRTEVTVRPFTPRRRILMPQGLDPRRGRRERHAQGRGTDQVVWGRETIDLRSVEQLVDSGQTRALAQALLHAQWHYIDGQRSLAEVLDCVEQDLAAGGLDALDQRQTGELVWFRRFELAATLNRLRSLQVSA